MSHRFDRLEFCRNCGRGKAEIEDSLAMCHESTEDARKRVKAERSYRDVLRALGLLNG